MLELYKENYTTLSPTQTMLYKQIEKVYDPSTEYIVFQLRNLRKKGEYITHNELKMGIYKGIKDYIQYYIYPLCKRKFIKDNMINSLFDYIGIIEYPQSEDENINLHIHLFIKPKVEVDINEMLVLMKERITFSNRKKNKKGDLVDDVFHHNLYDYSYSNDFISYHTKTFKHQYLYDNVLTNIELV